MFYKQLPKPPAVLLDFDGLLVHSMHVIFNSYRYAYQRMGLSRPGDEELIANLRGSARTSFPNIFGEGAGKAWQYYQEHYLEIFLDPEKGIKPIDGAQEFLIALQQAKIPVAIVTNKISDFTVREIEHLGWSEYLPIVVGSGDVATDKPHAEPLLHALTLLKIEHSPNIWMAGDTKTDIVAAQNAGCVPILVNETANMPDADLFYFQNMEQLLADFQQLHNAGVLKYPHQL